MPKVKHAAPTQAQRYLLPESKWWLAVDLNTPNGLLSKGARFMERWMQQPHMNPRYMIRRTDRKCPACPKSPQHMYALTKCRTKLKRPRKQTKKLAAKHLASTDMSGRQIDWTKTSACKLLCTCLRRVDTMWHCRHVQPPAGPLQLFAVVVMYTLRSRPTDIGLRGFCRRARHTSRRCSTALHCSDIHVQTAGAWARHQVHTTPQQCHGNAGN